MFTTKRVLWRISGSGPSRLSFAQSTATRTRSPASSGSVLCSRSSAMKWYSFGGGVSPAGYPALSVPSSPRARCKASNDPSASPSGFSWVVIRKRSWSRIASTTAARSVVVWGELIDQLGHAHAALDGRIVLEGELRGPLHLQLPAQARLGG